jgi:inosine-uridine nucleoside N-ribohydrolase
VPKVPLLVDADPSLATFGLDVDDDLALLFLLGSPEVELLGVTTVFGNSFGAFTHLSARRTLESAGRGDLPVVRGADSARDAAGARRAGDALAASVRAHPGATLLALGPLTNVAAAAADSDFGARLGALVVMGGRARSSLSDFNVRKDPAAAARVLALSCPKTLVTLDLGLSVAISPADAAAACANPASAVARHRGRLRRFARAQSAYRTLRGREPREATGGFHPWDVLAAAAVTTPELFTFERARIAFDARGRTCLDPPRGGAAVWVATSVDAPGFRALFLSRVAEPRTAGG